MRWWDNAVVGLWWEMRGYYDAGRGYYGYGRLKALIDAALHGWRRPR